MRAKSAFKPKQKNAQAFKLPTRDIALQGLDVKMRAGRNEDEEGPASTRTSGEIDEDPQ